MEKGKVRWFRIDVGEKRTWWKRLVVKGTTSHGSVPLGDNPVERLVRGLNRIVAYQTPVRLTPAVDRFFKAQARDQTGEAKARLSNAAAALKTKRGRAWLLGEPERNALLRATITPTVLKGSEKTNIIPQEASVELDIRLLPDEDTVAFRRTLERLIADPKIEIEAIGDMAPPYSAPLDTEMFRARGRHRPPLLGHRGADLLRHRSVAGGAGGEPVLGARQRRAALDGEHRIRAQALRGDGDGDGTVNVARHVAHPG